MVRRRSAAGTGSITAALTLLTPALVAAEPNDTPAASYLPGDCTVVATIIDGQQRVDEVRALLEAHEFADSPLAEALNSNPELIQARIGLLGLAAAAGTDAWGAVGALLGREVAVGLVPGELGDDPSLIMAAVPREGETVRRFIDTVHGAIGLKRGGEPDPAQTHSIEGVTVYPIGDDGLQQCFVGDVLLAANDTDLLREAIRAQRKGTGRLIDLPAYRDARADVPAEALAWAYADTADLERAGVLAEGIPALADDPMAGVLFGAWQHIARHASGATAWLRTHADGLTLDLALETDEALPTTHAGFVPATLHPARWKAEALPGFLAEVSVARDWADLFSERESILTLPAASDFVNFANTISSLTGRVDFVDDVMANVSGPVRIIAANRDFEGLGFTPTPTLPAFAMTAPLEYDEPRRFERQLYAAARATISIIAIDQAQKEQPQMMLEQETYRETKIVRGVYPDPDEAWGDEEDEGAEDDDEDDQGHGMRRVAGEGSIYHNFDIAMAIVRGELVLASSMELMHHIIDAAARPLPDARGTTVRDTAIVDGPRLARILETNREELVISRMIEEGQTRTQAEQEIALFLELLAYLDRVDVTSTVDGRTARATLDLHVDLED